MKKFLLVLAVIVLFLAPPYVFKDRKHYRLLGPSLRELQYTEVTFRNGDLDLAGMLFLPEGKGPFPVAVLVQGSGQSRRDNAWYLSVVKHLQESGIAVLDPDKRGSGKSGGDWKKATFRDLAGDASSAVDFVDSLTTFQHSTLGVIGFSQGGWITPIVAAENDKVNFVVTMSGAAVSTDEQLFHEVTNDIARAGTYHFLARIIAPIPDYFVRRSDFWQLIGGFDPIPYWKKVKVPVFMAFGEGDRNVPVGKSLERIRALNQINISTRVYPKGGHAIFDPITQRVQEQYLDDLTNFILNASR